MTICVRELVAAPIERVWEILGDFGGLDRWHPAVERCEIFGSGVEARRVVYFRDWTAEEKLEIFDAAGHTFEYRVTASSRPETVGVWGRISLTRLDAGRTALEWQSGVPETRSGAAEMEQMLRAYYPTRISHLRQALGVSA